ncbi:MAG: SprT family zinc-dependent metalloprotease [bacterium]
MFSFKKTITINNKEFGPVNVVKNKRSKHVKLKIHNTGVVSITSPSLFMGERYFDTLIESKSDWIRDKIKKLKSEKKNIILFDVNTKFQTKKHRLSISEHDGPLTKVRVSEGIIAVKYPKDKEVSTPEIQKEIKSGIEKALKIEALEYIPHRVKGLSNKFNLKYNNIVIKNIRTRWGSCSSSNNLNFNVHVMRLPENLIDYVILHELAHTVEKNHGTGFWSLLGNFIDNPKKLNKDLKSYRIEVISSDN